MLKDSCDNNWLILISLCSDKEHKHMYIQHVTHTSELWWHNTQCGNKHRAKNLLYLQVECSIEFQWLYVYINIHTYKHTYTCVYNHRHKHIHMYTYNALVCVRMCLPNIYTYMHHTHTITSRRAYTRSLFLINPPPRENRRHFADDIFKCIFLNENFEFSLKFHWSLFSRVQLTISKHWFR